MANYTETFVNSIKNKSCSSMLRSLIPKGLSECLFSRNYPIVELKPAEHIQDKLSIILSLDNYPRQVHFKSGRGVH